MFHGVFQRILVRQKSVFTFWLFIFRQWSPWIKLAIKRPMLSQQKRFHNKRTQSNVIARFEFYRKETERK